MRYAKALMAYAEERGAEERLYHELVTLAHSFRTVKGFCAVLDNPIVSVNEKFNLICTAADGDHKPSEEFIRFILFHNFLFNSYFYNTLVLSVQIVPFLMEIW